MNYDCPNCKSQNTQKVEIVYLSGVSDLSGKTESSSLGISSRGGLGVSVSDGSFSGTQQSLLSQSLAPPVYPSSFLIGGVMLFFLSFIFLIFSDVLFVVSLLVSFFLFILQILDKEKIDKYKKENELYYKKFICLRCGNIFIPEDN